jgi:hypothetical protein
MKQFAPTRNDTIEFCRRVRRNLEFIENAKKDNPATPVHAVTQLTLSLLGLVVFPYEKVQSSVFAKPVEDMQIEGWFCWSITLDSPLKGKPITRNLGDLLWHLRNAVAHGRLRFTSDSAELEDVAMIVEDKPNGKDALVNWRAEITGCHLRHFCLKLLEFVDGAVG